jgi:hypothetical protein
MQVPLAKYCAYWFVTHRLGVSSDVDPPRDEAIDDVDRPTLAAHILDDVNEAELRAGVDLVEVDARAFAAAAATWRTVFDAADSVLSCARRSGAPSRQTRDASSTSKDDQLAPKALTLAFSDYIITRWIFREVWGFDARKRPTDRELPPPFRNADARRGLAESLASNCRRVGIQLRDRGKFTNASVRWRWVSDARTALINQVTALLLLGVCASTSEAQLADPASNDQIVGVFFQKAKDDDWQGGVVSRGDHELYAGGRVKFTWQLDYGSRGGRQVTPSGTIVPRETDVSKNSGVYTVSYVRLFRSAWRITADAGLEHKRLLKGDSRADAPSALVNGSIRNVGSRLLGRDANRAPELAWSLQTNVTTSKAIATATARRQVFLDPVAVLWLSVFPGHIPREPDEEPRMFYRVQLRAEGAAMQPFDFDDVDNIDDFDFRGQAHWDASVVFFFTPANGVMLRRFSGFFDHNLRDRKNATTVNLLWKF